MRESWDSYFISIAHSVSRRSTCLSNQVGAVIVRDKRILATGYSAPPSGDAHCTDQGFCYPGVPLCSGSTKPSRAIHAEANAIGQCAAYGIPTKGATLYVTLQPCVNCLKLCLAAGIHDIIYASPHSKPSTLFDHIIHQRQHDAND